MTARKDLPSEIYAVPVTISLLVDARGNSEAARIEDAILQARNWGREAVKSVGEPVKLNRSNVLSVETEAAK